MRELEEGKHHCYRLQYDWNKYGITGFDFCVLEICDEDELLFREQYYIDVNYNGGMIYNTKLKIKNKNILSNTKIVKKQKTNTTCIPKDIEYKNMGIVGERALIYILNKIMSSKDKYIEISVREYCKETDTISKNIYSEFIKYTDNFRDISINGNKVFEACEYNDGILVITISDFALEYVNNINNNLNLMFNILDINKIACTKTIKLLTHILRFGNNMTVSQIRQILNIEDGQYIKYANLKDKAINPVIDDLRKIGIEIDIKEIKEKRRVNSIEFKIL